MVDFTQALHKVAVLFEELAQGHNLGHGLAKMRLQIPHLRCVGPRTGHHRSARRGAHGLLAVGPFENGSLPRQFIHVRREGIGIAITSHLRAKVVHRDHQDVHFTFRGRRWRDVRGRAGNGRRTTGQHRPSQKEGKKSGCHGESDTGGRNLHRALAISGPASLSFAARNLLSRPPHRGR